MIQDPFSGDPKLILGPQGSALQWSGGQCLMDQGIENQATLSLFTATGWVGNLLLPTANAMGSPFEQTVNALAITSKNLNVYADAATKALKYFPEVVVSVTNPVSTYVKMTYTVGPGQAPLSVQKYGPNWQQQALNPASAKVTVQV